MVSKILFALLCSTVINVQAMVMTPDQPSGSASSKPAAQAVHAKSAARTNTESVAKPAPLPVLSKASAGFCQAFHYSQNPNYDMMELYLQQGADINAFCSPDIRATALYESLSYLAGVNNYQAADWLIQHGADINIPAEMDGVRGVTLPMRVAGNSLGDVDQKALNYLIQHGANFHSVDSLGRTALQLFKGWWIVGYQNVASGDISGRAVAFIDQLIGQGIDINLQDKSGTTALMNAVVSLNQSCSSKAVILLLSHGANPALKNKLGKSALDLAIDRATQAGQADQCNEVVKILYNPQQISKSFSGKPGVANNSTSTNSGQQGGSGYVGIYGGTYSGLDEGVIQADILQDGTATLHIHSNKSGGTVTHEGKVNSDGSILFGKPGTGAVFSGTISRAGVLAGTWQAPDGDKGSFQGEKGVQVDIPATNLLKVFGSLFK